MIITGGNGNDTITGTSAGDIINAGNGNDTVNAGAGNDVVSGGNGNDTINGGAGNDILDGGNGNDILDGGAGRLRRKQQQSREDDSRSAQTDGSLCFARPLRGSSGR